MEPLPKKQIPILAPAGRQEKTSALPPQGFPQGVEGRIPLLAGLGLPSDMFRRR